MWCFALSCPILLFLVWPKTNQSHTCLWLLATLVIGLHNVPDEYYICAKWKMDIYIYWIIICWKLTKTQTKRDQARQDGASPRQVAPGSESSVCGQKLPFKYSKNSQDFFYIVKYLPQVLPSGKVSKEAYTPRITNPVQFCGEGWNFLFLQVRIRSARTPR